MDTKEQRLKEKYPEKEVTLELTFTGLTEKQVEKIQDIILNIVTLLGGSAAGGIAEVSDEEEMTNGKE